MVLGPIWNDRHTRFTSEENSAELVTYVGQVAEELAGEFERIEHATNGWADDDLATALVDVTLSRTLAQLAETGCWGRANQVASSELWRVAGRWLEKGWLQHRARTKPRGYAGDDELQQRICAGTLSTDPLGRAFDRFFQATAAASAVRSRTEQMAAALVPRCLASEHTPFRVVSVGSGPAIEIERAARLLPESARDRLTVTLVDLDQEALDGACRRLSSVLKPEQFTARRENLFRLANNPRLASCVGPADFSFCTGLFDYLAAEPAQALLRTMWEGLVPDGVLFVGNFAPHNPTRAYMEWIGNWYLIYRTREELLQLALDAGLPREVCSVGAERLGVDLFLCARKA